MSQSTVTTQYPAQTRILAAAAIIALGLVILSYNTGATRLAAAAFIGITAGIALYHASFGFASAWRRFVFERRGAGLRAQILLILLTCAITFPLLASGGIFGRDVHGSVAPFGLSAAFGAFIFGIGMQFGGSCASGTLFTTGGGNTRMLATLAGFIAGSVIATAHLPFWWSLPDLPRYSLVEHLGPINAYALTTIVLGGLFVYSRRTELRHHSELEHDNRQFSLVRGPWPKWWGAVALVFVSVATLLVLSRPWGITSAFTLWGAKLAQLAGMSFDQWPYWANRQAWLDQPVWADSTSVMNFGIIIGAFTAAALAGKFAPTFRLPAGVLIVSIIGGLMMGYGARLAYGCNIGAYLGGVISGSLHGWGWLVFGFLGTCAAGPILRKIKI